MRPAPFDYLRPDSVPAAVEGLGRGGVVLAGGQTLIQAMRLRQAAPGLVVDISALAELGATVTWDVDGMTVGARVTQARFLADPAVAAEFPWLAQAAALIGDVQVRNRGTVVGNVCWADPRANMAVALLASDAAIRIAMGQGERDMPLGDFFRGFRAAALDNGLATAIHVPRPPRGARGCYAEFSRQPQDLALCNVCAVLAPGHARVAVGGIHVTPVRLRGLEQLLAAGAPDGAALEEAIAAAVDAAAFEPCDRLLSPPDYQRHLAKVTIRRTLAACAEQGHG